MDHFLYNLYGYPLWHKRADVLSAFDLPQALPLRKLYEYLEGNTQLQTCRANWSIPLAVNRLQFAAATLAWSRMFASEDQSYVGGKFEDYLLTHTIAMPTSWETAQQIGQALTERTNPIYAYCFQFQCLDAMRKVMPEADKWQMMYRDKTGRKEWYTRNAKGRLKWLAGTAK